MTLNYRRDNRTLEEFKADIEYRTAKEKFLIELYGTEMRHLGHKVRIENNGIDNTGQLQKKVNTSPDYKITIDNYVAYLEVKNSPVSSKWTFKVHNLKAYVKAKAYILVFWGTGYIDKDPSNIDLKKTFYGIISPSKTELMLESYQHYSEPKFGNKTCIQIPHSDFSKWLNIKRITHRE